AELIALPITFVLLLFVYGSAVAAALPLAVGASSVVGTLFILRVIASVTSVSIFSEDLTTALGLGLAIDYSLFIVSRFREELASGQDTDEAVRRTLATAGKTVIGSSLTVAGALAILLVFPMVFLRSFAYAGIPVALLSGGAAVVILPAVLALLGPRVNGLTVWKRSVLSGVEGFWSRLARAVMRRPVVFLLGTLALLCALGSPFLGLKLGYLDYRVLPPGDHVRVVDQRLTNEFGQGSAEGLTVVVPKVGAPEHSAARAQLVDAYATKLSRLGDVQMVAAETGVFVHGTHLPAPTSYADQFTNPTGTWLSVVPSVDALEPAGQGIVQQVRDVPAPFGVLVGGMPAENVDATQVILSRLPLALGLIALVSFVVLFLMFGSVLIPLKALVLNVLSLSATFGAMVWVFQEGHLSSLLGFTATGNVLATIPLLMFCVAFGLSMDYEVFLISRIKEQHDAGADNATAVARGLQRTGRIVTAAALTMTVVFLSVMTSGIAFIKLFGLGLTLAVLVDAFIVRGMLVPAFMRLAGPANWWAPKFLRHLLRREPRTPASPSGPPEPVGAERTIPQLEIPAPAPARRLGRPVRV
ncbi:MAG TPA: MMPL family transporter, partial [Acidimicrobiales bacterium]|nr:MMPL family transporter [Acidimicrobiales bacterium]